MEEKNDLDYFLRLRKTYLTIINDPNADENEKIRAKSALPQTQENIDRYEKGSS